MTVAELIAAWRQAVYDYTDGRGTVGTLLKRGADLADALERSSLLAPPASAQELKTLAGELRLVQGPLNALVGSLTGGRRPPQTGIDYWLRRVHLSTETVSKAAATLDHLAAGTTPGTFSEAEVREFTANLLHEHDDFVHSVSDYYDFIQSRLRGRAARLHAPKADPTPEDPQ